MLGRDHVNNEKTDRIDILLSEIQKLGFAGHMLIRLQNSRPASLIGLLLRIAKEHDVNIVVRLSLIHI